MTVIKSLVLFALITTQSFGAAGDEVINPYKPISPGLLDAARGRDMHFPDIDDLERPVEAGEREIYKTAVLKNIEVFTDLEGQWMTPSFHPQLNSSVLDLLFKPRAAYVLNGEVGKKILEMLLGVFENFPSDPASVKKFQRTEGVPQIDNIRKAFCFYPRMVEQYAQKTTHTPDDRLYAAGAWFSMNEVLQELKLALLSVEPVVLDNLVKIILSVDNTISKMDEDVDAIKCKIEETKPELELIIAMLKRLGTTSVTPPQVNIQREFDKKINPLLLYIPAAFDFLKELGLVEEHAPLHLPEAPAEEEDIDALITNNLQYIKASIELYTTFVHGPIEKYKSMPEVEVDYENPQLFLAAIKLFRLGYSSHNMSDR